MRNKKSSKIGITVTTSEWFHIYSPYQGQQEESEEEGGTGRRAISPANVANEKQSVIASDNRIRPLFKLWRKYLRRRRREGRRRNVERELL